MADPQPSTSEITEQEEGEGSQQGLYITHQVSKLDTLAGLAVKYNVTVSDIKRANGLLSDSAMFAKDTLLVPTRTIPVGVEYSTWAGMIVTQYGKIPGDSARSLGFGGNSPPKQSASLDMLQRYYGTGDTASEPSDFRPGESDRGEGSVNGTEIELSNMDSTVEYAGTRSGSLGDERLRRRRAGEYEDSSPQRERAGSEPGEGGGGGWQHRRTRTQLAQPAAQRETLLERLKRVASQPALALPPAPSLSRISDAVIAPLAEALPPLPPGASRVRERTPSFATPRGRSKEGQKGD